MKTTQDPDVPASLLAVHGWDRDASALLISRRAGLGCALDMAGGLVLAPRWAAGADNGELQYTQENVLGPFEPRAKPMDRDADLTRIRGRKGRAQGTVVDLRGRVVNLKGEPMRGVRLDLWQANAAGRCAHPRPVAVAREVPVPRDGGAGSVALNWDIVLDER